MQGAPFLTRLDRSLHVVGAAPALNATYQDLRAGNHWQSRSVETLGYARDDHVNPGTLHVPRIAILNALQTYRFGHLEFYRDVRPGCFRHGWPPCQPSAQWPRTYMVSVPPFMTG